MGPIQVNRKQPFLFVIVAATACANLPTAPENVFGVYELRRMNEAPMPYDNAGLGCCTYLTGELEIQDVWYAISLTARNRNTGVVFTASEWGQHQLQATGILFVSDSFSVAPFLLDTAMIRQDTIQVAFGGEGPGSPDQFHALFVVP